MEIDQSFTIEFAVIGVYLVLLASIGIVYKKFSADTSDFFRAGAKAPWWLVGSSIFMQMFSAWTFTGAAGSSYVAGWSVLIIFWGNCFGFLCQFALVGPWFRQIRAVSPAEVVRRRYGPWTEQFYALTGMFMGVIWGSVQLYGLAIFSSSVFGYNINLVILILGLVVIIYSSLGGSWAVMTSDFLQSLIILPITLAVSYVCLQHIGGLEAFFEGIRANGLAMDYKIFNEPGHFDNLPHVAAGSFTIGWASAWVINGIVGHNSLQSAPKYFSVKDGLNARKAALLACVLMFVGSLIWFIPPMVGRMLYNEEIMAMNLRNPAESAYAVMAMKLLPAGLTGIIVVAMFTATMSSMDSGLTFNAANITRNIYPALARRMKWNPAEGRKLLFIGRAVNFTLALCIIATAIYMANYGRGGIFQVVLNIAVMVGAPMGMPMFLGIFFKRVPFWAAIASVATGLLASGYFFVSETFFNADPVIWQHKGFAIMALSATGFFLSKLFYSEKDVENKERVDAFFKTMYTPVDFEKEVGLPEDTRLLKIVGFYGSVIGAGILLMLLPNPIEGRLVILGVGGFIFLASLGLFLLGKQGSRRIKKALEEKNLLESETGDSSTD